MAQVAGQIIINRPVEEVFGFVADERNEPRYNPRMLLAEQISDSPIGAGTRFQTELRTVGRTIRMVVEFTGYELPSRLASVTRSSMMETDGALTFESVPEGTRMRWSWDVRPRGALKLLAPFVGAIGRRQERSIWRNLKRLLESEVQPGVGSQVRPMTAAKPGPERPTASVSQSPTGPTGVAGVTGQSHVLVAYASEHGSTRGVAERIAARLGERGARVEVRPVVDVDDLGGYDAVVLGSGVYNQRWIPSATEFLRGNAALLAARRVWLFSVGSFGDTYRLIGRLMKREPKEIGEFQDAIHPHEYRVFAGAIERHQWPLPSRLFLHALGGRFGDNRDWPQIDAWAESIARTLQASKRLTGPADAARADPEPRSRTGT